MPSDRATGKSSNGSTNRPRRYPYLAICVENRGNEASLQIGKAYRIIRPMSNDPANRVRAVDEEGEDYLYLAKWFVPIDVPPRSRRQVLEAVSSGTTGVIHGSVGT